MHYYSLVLNTERAVQTTAIKRMDLERHLRVPGEIKRSRDLRGGRWSWTLTFAQKRS